MGLGTKLMFPNTFPNVEKHNPKSEHIILKTKTISYTHKHNSFVLRHIIEIDIVRKHNCKLHQAHITCISIDYLHHQSSIAKYRWEGSIPSYTANDPSICTKKILP